MVSQEQNAFTKWVNLPLVITVALLLVYGT